jgi:hypothetical protein
MDTGAGFLDGTQHIQLNPARILFQAATLSIGPVQAAIFVVEEHRVFNLPAPARRQHDILPFDLYYCATKDS